ncbi:MAG: lytic transglycosylase domain-containing protein [Oxalobacteraceae bacterium]|nr:MAG: lytic transglycosylase domain-containing protein [Oxalobacteraceae bacterium]
MRYLPGLVVASAILIVSSQATAATRSQSVRQVQLISMIAPASIETPVTAEGPSGSTEALELPDVPAGFQVHDLSRRYVQFRMQQAMIAAAVPTDPGASSISLTRGVAEVSSIAVPTWMRAGVGNMAGMVFRPGCAPMSYRPAGFLNRGAEARRAAYYGMMSAIACDHGIPTGLFDAMIIRESGYNPLATSTANAFGLAQLMPGTAISLGVDRYDPVQNLRGGARYFRNQLDRFGQVHLALAAYNAGPGRVRGGLIPRISETQSYVTNIIANWSRLTSGFSTPAASTIPPRQYTRVAAVTQF